jgi:hypothetical protein
VVVVGVLALALAAGILRSVRHVSVGEELADGLGVVRSAVLELAALHDDDVVGLAEELDLRGECAWYQSLASWG